MIEKHSNVRGLLALTRTGHPSVCLNNIACGEKDPSSPFFSSANHPLEIRNLNAGTILFSAGSARHSCTVACTALNLLRSTYGSRTLYNLQGVPQNFTDTTYGVCPYLLLEGLRQVSGT